MKKLFASFLIATSLFVFPCEGNAQAYASKLKRTSSFTPAVKHTENRGDAHPADIKRNEKVYGVSKSTTRQLKGKKRKYRFTGCPSF